MNLVDHLSEKYNVELTGIEGYGKYDDSCICLDITSHFEDLPPFVKEVKLCIESEKLILKEYIEKDYDNLSEECLKQAIKKRNEKSHYWKQDWQETLVLICDGDYVIKVACEYAVLLMKKIDDPEQILCSIQKNIDQIKEQKEKEHEEFVRSVCV